MVYAQPVVIQTSFGLDRGELVLGALKTSWPLVQLVA
jgi:hypothetical protein